MHDLGINIDRFNPKVLYVFRRKFQKSSSKTCLYDFPAMIYMLSGSALYNIDGNGHRVARGNLVVVNPGVPHFRVMPEGGETNEFHIGFNNIQLEGMDKDCLLPPGRQPVISMKKYEREFFEGCCSILVEQKRNEPGGQLMLKSLVMRLIILFLKEVCTVSKVNEENPIKFESCDRTKIVTSIASYMNTNYGQDISLDRISQNIYLSPVYISRIFKEEIGESPINYLIKVRLSKAADLLENGSSTVKSVARQVGYSDAYYFSKLFKKYYGMPPSEYSRKHSS